VLGCGNLTLRIPPRFHFAGKTTNLAVDYTQVSENCMRYLGCRVLTFANSSVIYEQAEMVV
jgi:hypothetical protein